VNLKTFAKYLFFINFYIILPSSADEMIKVDARPLNIANLKIPTTVSVLARVCCTSNKFAGEPTWTESEKYIVTLKIRMSKGSRIRLYNEDKLQSEEFICEKPGCFGDRLINVYEANGLKHNIDKFKIKYYCGGSTFRSKINDEPVEKFVGIQVLKGQVKTDDTSDDRIWCMEKTPGDNIWTADEFYKSNGKGNNRSTQRAKVSEEGKPTGGEKSEKKDSPGPGQQVELETENNPA